MLLKISKLCASISVFIWLLSNVVMAQNILVSEWQKTEFSAARAHILSATNQDIILGVEINIVENYKTYWQSPGSTGVPAMVEISGANIMPDGQKILYPHPQKFINKYGETWGYKDKIVLFIELKRQYTNLNSPMNVIFDYAVCDVICLPERAVFNLKLDAGDLQKTMAFLKFGKYFDRLPEPIDFADSALSSIQYDAANRLNISLNSAVVGDLFITDNQNRFYQLFSASSSHLVYNILGMKLAKSTANHSLTIHYFNGQDYLQTQKTLN
ncbi:MAG: hypothetical protein HRU29_03880 [Rhizobiales bacterium]|nr:hypothetical protein [Hyphomicrobiales bacterium]NRB13520.1 hypothetical protein [Hyphomicrobiales bacterium]